MNDEKLAAAYPGECLAVERMAHLADEELADLLRERQPIEGLAAQMLNPLGLAAIDDIEATRTISRIIAEEA